MFDKNRTRCKKRRKNFSFLEKTSKFIKERIRIKKSNLPTQFFSSMKHILQQFINFSFQASSPPLLSTEFIKNILFRIRRLIDWAYN